MPSGFENIVHGYTPREWGVSGGGNAGGIYGSVESPAIPLTEYIDLIPTFKNFQAMKDGSVSMTPGASLRANVPMWGNGLLGVGAGVEQSLGNRPWHDTSLNMYGGVNVKGEFDSNPLVDAIIEYVNRK